MFRKFLIVILSAACLMALASCGTGASAETAAEAAPEKASAREDVTRTEWSLDDIAALSEVVSGITDREYAASEGAAYKIHKDVTYDRGIVYTVLLNTASVRFDTPGTYDMTYWVYFDAAALKAWADGNGVSLDIPDAGRLAVWVSATVTVTEAEEDEDDGDAGDAEDDAAEAAEDDAAEADEDTASGGSEGESASAGAGSGSESGSGSSSKSASSGSSKNSGSGSSSKSASSGSSKSGGSGSSTSASSGSSKSGSSGSSSKSASSGSSKSGGSGSSTSASSGSSKSGSSGSSSKSASSGSSKSSGSTSVCSHNWVDEGHYESVLVQAAYDEKVDTGRGQYVCNKCGYGTTDVMDIAVHTMDICNCGYHSEILYEYVHHDAVYKTQWVSSYKCSKCGATK